MKIKHLLSAAAAVVFFGACSDYDPGQSGNVEPFTDKELETLAEYDKSFVDRYGTPALNHTWGFGEVGVEGAANAQTRSVNVNRNQWNQAVKENGVITGYTTWTNNQGKTMVVPGFPSSVDGLYHIEENVPTGEHVDNEWGGYDVYETKNMAYTEDVLIQKGQDSYLPVGDVTDEEIQYVSEWFRTHQYPDSEVPEFTEFYIQDISQDVDRVSYPNGAAINPNLQVYVNGQPDPAHPGFYKGGEADNGTDPLSYGMDYFAVKTSEGEWEHENNFNAQKANKIGGTLPTNSTTFPNRTLKYWTTNGGYTTSFMYYNSDQSQKYENYVLVHLSFTGPRSGLHYDGYYLAFDYQYVKQHSTSTDPETGETTYKYSQQLPDGYYSNWIVKLSPANPDFKDHEWYRVMCEDLGNTYDFDFNDLVFDVYFSEESSQIYANVRVQAAGGTLPIYVGYDSDEAYEAHKLLGQASTSIPVNVDAGSSAAPSSIIKIPVSEANPDAVDIYVGKKSAEGTKTTILLPRVGSTSSSTPQKICVPGNTVRWTQEHKQLGSGTSSYVGAYAEGAYPYFNEWVQHPDGDYGFEGATPWTTTSVNTGMLH